MQVCTLSLSLLPLCHATSLLCSYSVVLLSFSLGGTLSREIELHQITARLQDLKREKETFSKFVWIDPTITFM